jgi:hypothetical protein
MTWPRGCSVTEPTCRTVHRTHPYCVDGQRRVAHDAPVRVLPHIKKLDDALGDFIVRVTVPVRRLQQRHRGSSEALQHQSTH